MHDRIFVTIAVSQPKGLAELPGAITSAKRMASWAAANGYRVVSIDDSKAPVTIDLIKKMLTPILGEIDPLNRLVVFFAGHGAAKDANTFYWLLSNWLSSWSEAVEVSAFQRVLRYYRPKQLTLIGDCCRVIHKSFMNVTGNEVLEMPETEPRNFELDRFFAADAGEESFMIRASGSSDSFCIFTEVLLDALEGDAEDAFDIRRVGERTVTSGSLGEHLKTAVPLEASRHRVIMIPRAEPGFYRDDVYARFPPAALAGEPPALGGGGPDFTAAPPRRSVPKAELVPAPQGAPPVDKERASAERAEREQRKGGYLADFNPSAVPTHFETGCGLAVLGVEQASVECSSGMVHRDPNHPGIWFPVYAGGAGLDGRDWTNLLVELDRDRIAYVCGVQGRIATLQVHDRNRATVVYRRLWDDPNLALPSIDLLARANAGLLSSDQIVDAAAELRVDKHTNFALGCLASYLYDSIGDVDSIRSIAAYYAQAGQMIPLDVALLSNGLLYFDHSRLFVDIPETAERRPRTELEERRQFAWVQTDAIEHALVGGSVPWMRGGWTAISTARFDESASQWRRHAAEIAEHLAPAPFTMVRKEGHEALADLLGIRIGEFA